MILIILTHLLVVLTLTQNQPEVEAVASLMLTIKLKPVMIFNIANWQSQSAADKDPFSFYGRYRSKTCPKDYQSPLEIFHAFFDN